ncbi:MAG: tetratricopeptide repeat protein [Bacteroidota bacterium]|nr:tetratricopeptide repeat protein [Bacteroidota bacterium]
MSKNNTEEKDDLREIGNVLSRSEQFIEKNQKYLYIVLGVIVVAVSAVILFRHMYLMPKEQEAQEMIYVGEQYFAIDSFKVALNGDGANFIGFQGIIDDYGLTKTAKLASAYAGLCYKNMGDYDNAIKYLNKCKAKDIMVSPALLGAIGDCYVELKDYSKAVSFFQKAAETKNELLAPIYLMKAARVYEKTADLKNALKMYKRIQKEYPLTQEGLDVEKYIDRAEANL